MHPGRTPIPCFYACPFPGHQPREIPGMTFLLLRDMEQQRLGTQTLCKRLIKKKYPLFFSTPPAIVRMHCHADQPDAACHACLAFLLTPNSCVLLGLQAPSPEGLSPGHPSGPIQVSSPVPLPSSDTFLSISFALLQHRPASVTSGFFGIGKITWDWTS